MQSMKKWFIIFVAFMQLTSTTQLSQLYKFPIFISHFIEHSKNNITFQELIYFVEHHYNGHGIDEDYETDHKLPFMHVDRVHLDPCYVSEFNFSIAVFSYQNNSHPYILWADQIVYFQHLNTIWQPPKNV